MLGIAVDYMYGIDIPDLVKIQTLHLNLSLLQDWPKLAKILEISEIFLMADLKAQVEKLAIKMINRANVKE